MTTKTIDDYAQEIISLRHSLHQATEAIEILKGDIVLRDEIITELREALQNVKKTLSSPRLRL